MGLALGGIASPADLRAYAWCGNITGGIGGAISQTLTVGGFKTGKFISVDFYATGATGVSGSVVISCNFLEGANWREIYHDTLASGSSRIWDLHGIVSGASQVVKDNINAYGFDMANVTAVKIDMQVSFDVGCSCAINGLAVRQADAGL
jgi:hypothetical protein